MERCHKELTDKLFQEMLDFLEQRRADKIMEHITESLMSPEDNRFEHMRQAIADAARNDNSEKLREALEMYADHLYGREVQLLCETNFELVKEAAQTFEPWNNISEVQWRLMVYAEKRDTILSLQAAKDTFVRIREKIVPVIEACVTNVSFLEDADSFPPIGNSSQEYQVLNDVWKESKKLRSDIAFYIHFLNQKIESRNRAAAIGRFVYRSSRPRSAYEARRLRDALPYADPPGRPQSAAP